MSGRQTFRARCAADGCPEQAFYDRLTVLERRDLARRLQRSPWRCTRHIKPNEVLSAGNPTRTVVLTAERSKRYPDLGAKLFWREEGREDVGSGFEHGPGFKAWADDFPEGTRLVITAAIEATAPSAGGHDERGSGAGERG